MVGSWKADVTFTGWTASPLTFRYSFFSSPKFFYAHVRDGIEWFYGISATGDDLKFSDIAVNNDYVYLLGSFSGELTVSDSEGRYYATRNSWGDTDLFLLQLGKSGALVSVNQLGSEGEDYGDQLAIDANGSLLVAGRFNGTTNFLFDPDDNWIAPITSEGSDLFVARYAPELGDGSIRDLTILGGPEDQTKVTGLLVDPNNDVYVSGQFTKAIRVREAISNGAPGEESATTAGSKQVFFSRLNQNLAPRWLTVLEGAQEFNADGDLDYDPSTQQLLAVQDVTSPPTYQGKALDTAPQEKDAYVLRIDGTDGTLINHFLIGGAAVEDGKQIVSDGQGNYFVIGTFQRELTINQGGTIRNLSRSGTKNTFLAAFSSSASKLPDDRLVYLSGFSNEGNLYASRGMMVLNFGSVLTARIPFVYDQEAFGLDGASIQTNASGTYDIFIGSFELPSIPRITEVTPVFTSDRYQLRVRGTQLFSSSENDFAYRMGEGGQFAEGRLSETSEILLAVPDTWVAGTAYPLRLSKSFYEDFYQGSVSVPPVVTPLPAAASATCEETISLGGKYFGSVSTGVKVFFDHDGIEVSSATVSAVAPAQLQVQVPGVYWGQYQVRVNVNGQEAAAGNFQVLPALTQLSEATVLPGATVTVRGCAFIDANHGTDLLAVRLLRDGQDPIAVTTFTVAPEQPNQLTLTLPDPLPVGSYALEVTVNGVVAASNLTLDVVDANTSQPLITALSSGGEANPGDTLTITGKNLGSDPDQITVEIIEGQPLAVIAVNEAGTEITFKIPFDLPEDVYPAVIVKLGTQQAVGTLSLRVVPAVEPQEELLVTPAADNPAAYDPNADGLTLRAQVAGVTAADTVRLLISGLTRDTPQETATQLQEGAYAASLPRDQLSDPLGYEYRFVVKNGTTRGASDPVRVYRHYAQQPMTLHKPDRAEPEQGDYQLVAIPFQAQEVRQAWTGPGAFSTDSIRLLRHAPGAAAYQEYGSGFSQFEPGRGYWLLKRAGVPLAVQGTAVEVDADRSYDIELQAGWNLIGNPFPFDIDLGWLGERDQRVFRSDRYAEVDGSLKAYEGLFVESEEATTLRVSAVTDQSNGRTSTGGHGISRFANHPLDGEGWYVGFTATTDGVTNELAGVGMHPRAKSGYDAWDAQPLPRFKQFVELQFNNALTNKILERDIVPLAEQHIWQFKVATHPGSREARLAWDNRGWGRNDRALWLRDEVTRQRINLREVREYTFQPTHTERAFTLYYGPADQLTEVLLPPQVEVGAVYPNPAVDGVAIPVTIPATMGATLVSFTLTDATGRIVRNEQHYASGHHTLSWERHDNRQRSLPTGVYYYQLRVGSQVQPFTGKLIYHE